MTDMSELEDESFDVVLDKAAMDAIMTAEGDVWNPDQIGVDLARNMCRHISRILLPETGHHLQISFMQPHFRKKYLLGWHTNNNAPSSSEGIEEIEQLEDYSHEFGWTYRVEKITGGGNDDSFHHFLYCMTKEKR